MYSYDLKNKKGGQKSQPVIWSPSVAGRGVYSIQKLLPSPRFSPCRTEPDLVNPLRSPGIDSQPGEPLRPRNRLTVRYRQPYLKKRPARLHRLADCGTYYNTCLIPSCKSLEGLYLMVDFLDTEIELCWRILLALRWEGNKSLLDWTRPRQPLFKTPIPEYFLEIFNGLSHEDL